MYFMSTQMHMVTFCITAFEVIMLFFQVIHFLERTNDNKRLLYLIFLIAMILYNTTSGFLPDPKFNVSLMLQNVVAYFFAFSTSMYFVYYYYKAFDLVLLKCFANHRDLHSFPTRRSSD